MKEWESLMLHSNKSNLMCFNWRVRVETILTLSGFPNGNEGQYLICSSPALLGHSSPITATVQSHLFRKGRCNPCYCCNQEQNKHAVSEDIKTYAGGRFKKQVLVLHSASPQTTNFFKNDLDDRFYIWLHFWIIIYFKLMQILQKYRA